MHESVMEFVGRKAKQHNLRSLSVLECGSKHYNGSVRELFDGPYIGIDTQEGRCVDQIASANNLPFPEALFEVVVSTEMLEHDPAFWLSIPEMRRVLQPGGHLLLTTRGIGFPYHEYPGDYWRFTADSMYLLLDDWEEVVVEDDPLPGHPGVLVHARKPCDSTLAKAGESPLCQ